MVPFNCTIAIHTENKYRSSSKVQDTFGRIGARKKPRKIVCAVKYVRDNHELVTKNPRSFFRLTIEIFVEAHKIFFH